jgi:hypothetical protein
MTTSTSPIGAQRVECSVCLREIPRSEAVVPEASDYVAYFCGLECYEKWKSVKQHPQRDEPRVDSAEPDETPPT